VIKLIKTTPDHKDFKFLVSKLDAYLAIQDGDDHAFYNQYNSTDTIKHVILCYDDNNVVGCGTFKPVSATTVEIKRMYTEPSARGKGIATKIVKALEVWATSLGYTTCILETGIKLKEAIALYKKNNYIITENYGQYKGVATSVCFKKNLKN